MLYFAYGSNLLKAGMRQRCPAASAIGRATLRDYRRVFRLWADVEPDPAASVEGGLWRITPACLSALDAYEEIETGLYERVVLSVETEDGQRVDAWVYRMHPVSYAPPDPDYLAAVLRGCRDFGLDPGPVDDSVAETRRERVAAS